MISIDKTILLNLSFETIVHISSKLMVNMSNTFKKCLKRGRIKSLGSQTGCLTEGGGGGGLKRGRGLNRGNTVITNLN